MHRLLQTRKCRQTRRGGGKKEARGGGEGGGRANDSKGQLVETYCPKCSIGRGVYKAINKFTFLVLRTHQDIPAERQLLFSDQLGVVLPRLHHVAQIPQLDGLILAVTDQVPAIALGIQMSHAICVAHKHTSWPRVAANCALVPYLAV